MLKKDRKKSYQIWQGHHAQYDPPVIFRITRMEHFLIGCRAQKHWFKYGMSNGCWKLLKWVRKNYKVNQEIKTNKEVTK
jgi:hypothetical protein